MNSSIKIMLIVILTLALGEFNMVIGMTKEETSDQLILNARLVDAVKESNISMVKKILIMGADPNAEDDSTSALYISVSRKDAELVKILIKYGLDLKNCPYASEAFSLAASNFDLEIVKLLVQAGIDINAGDSLTPLHHACSRYRDDPLNGYLTIQYLISKGADVNAICRNDLNRKEEILCEAVACDDPKLVKLLLDAGTDVNTLNVYHATPLMVAAGMKNKNTKKIIQLLLKYGADVNVKQGGGETALYNVLYHHNPDPEIIKSFIQKGAIVHEKEMCCAARNGNPEIFNILHKTRPKIDYTEILYNAGEGGSVEIISIIEAKESGNPKLKENMLSAFFQATKNGHLKTVEYFLNNGADVNYRRNNDAEPVLLIASEQGHLEIVKLLLSRGADVNKVDDHGSSSLIAASINGQAPVVEWLLKNGADINHFEDPYWHRNPLLCACYYNQLDVVSILIEKGADLNVKNKEGESPLGIAISQRNYNLVTLLLEKGVDPESSSIDSSTLLISAAESENFPLIKILIKKKQKFRQNIRSGPALIAAAKNGNLEIVEFLLNNGADVSQYGSRALFASCSLNGKKGAPIAELLLAHKSPNNFCSSQGWTPLMVALENRYDDNGDIAKVLLTQKIEVNVTNDKGMTPLMYAAERGDIELVEVLLKKGAKINFQYRETNWNNFFEILAHNLYIYIINGFKNNKAFMLSMKEAYINCQFIGDTPLLIAASGEKNNNRTNKNSCNKIVKLLLEKGADVNALDSNDNSPLINASYGSSLETVQDIINAGADITAVNKGGMSALMIAAKSGNASIAELLLKSGSRLDEINRNSEDCKTALMFAVSEDHADVVKILLKNGADIYIKDRDDRTAMDFAKSSDVKALLLKKEESKDVMQLSATEKKLNRVIAEERQKKQEEDLALEEKDRKIYPKDTKIYKFIDPFGEPLSGAEFKVEYDGKKSIETTDKKGKIYLHKVTDERSIIIQNSNLNIMIKG